MSIAAFSTDAGSNASLGFAEGQAPSSLNDGIRGVLGHVRESYNDASWVDYRDGTPDGTYTRLSATSFKVTGGSSVTAKYAEGVRVRAIGTTTGTIYGSITDSSYSAPDTTVIVEWDSGSLANESLSICISAVEPKALPSNIGDSTNGASGYVTLPSGHIMQWGRGFFVHASTVTFPRTFPTSILSITVTPIIFIPSSSDYFCQVKDLTTANFQLLTHNTSGQTVISASDYYNYIAIGY